MSLRIQNVEAFNAYRHLNTVSSAVSKSMERPVVGYRINKAADDAAGPRHLRGGVPRSAAGHGARNIQDGVSLVQTAEGSLTRSTRCSSDP